MSAPAARQHQPADGAQCSGPESAAGGGPLGKGGQAKAKFKPPPPGISPKPPPPGEAELLRVASADLAKAILTPKLPPAA